MLLTIRELTKKIAHYAEYDYCPWANRYVYWLKEPVGWFVVGMLASLLVGAYLSPLGWSVAAGLATVIVLGLVFPWLATRSVRCELKPSQHELRERQETDLNFSVTNYLPIPITGLRLEGYFSEPWNNAEGGLRQSDCTLELIPAISRATYRLPVCPEYRGLYPTRKPRITCSFPFGIWTAQKTVENVSPILVQPLHIPVFAPVEHSGYRWSDHGPGKRPSTHGDFQGVRDFRDGDSLKSIHWAQSARNERLVVCERGGPQQPVIDVNLSTALSGGTPHGARENLAWRVRAAASVCDLLCARHIPFRFWLDAQLVALPQGPEGALRVRNLLATIPLDSANAPVLDNRFGEASVPTIRIHADDERGTPLSEQYIGVEVISPSSGYRRTAFSESADSLRTRGLIDLDRDIALQLNQLLTEADRATFAA